jgi:primosomal protein N' (replication factor Y)
MPDRRASSPGCAAPEAGEGRPPTLPRVRVMLPLPLEGTLDYLAPPGDRLDPGRLVRVPLGPRRLVGVVWEGTGGETLPAERLKPILELLPLPPLAAELRRFIERVAQYTLAPAGLVLRMAIGVAAALPPPRRRRLCRITAAGRAALAVDSREQSPTPARRRVLAALEGASLPVDEAARRAGCGAGVVRGLIARGFVEAFVAAADPPEVAAPRHWQATFPTFSADQERAAQRLVAVAEAGGFSVTLIDGVTGSGKTDTYFAAIASALARHRQVLVLLPEIALGAQWLLRFRDRFGVLPTEWHSDVKPSLRRNTWLGVAAGRVRVVVGARSALFLPFAELGLIVVDEEHDPSFKQEDGVVYQARDMAVLRASLADIPIALASATPSLETAVNVARGRYRRVSLPRRVGSARLPAVEIIDLRQAPPEPGRFLAPPLVAALAETFAAEEQALLFLNRRGYAPLTLCRSCGHRLECPSCTAWLVEHRYTGRLLCHHCGHAEPVPPLCPECMTAHSLVACGPGVERLVEEAAERFPAARTALMVSDLLPGPRAAADLAEAMIERRYDLLIGTQIVAKGHHFPMLTLVGAVDADLGLAGGDLRAAERTFQLLHQVGGRAGRAERAGRVLIQTHLPEQPVMQALVSGDRDRFLETEAAARRMAGLPPFGRLAALILSAADAETADAAARTLARAAPHLPEVEVLGPAPAPLAVLRGRHRRRFLLKAARRVNVQAVIREWLARVRLGAAARLQIDIDPYSFL